MICIKPMAPLDERARGLAPLSTCITARIQCSGTPKRRDASVTNAVKGGTDWLLTRCIGCEPRSACAASLHSIDDTKIVTKHSIVPRTPKAAVVLAAVKGEALKRRPDGRPGPPLRAAA